MKKKFWLTLYNIGVSILFLLSLYSYAKGMAGFSLFLALAVFGEIAARAFIECKYLQESPEIKEDTAYRITKVLRLLCEIILIIGVWRFVLNSHILKITLMIYSIFNERGGIRPSTSVASSFSIYFNQNLFHHIA